MSALRACVSKALGISYLVGGEGVSCVESRGGSGKGGVLSFLMFTPPSTHLQQSQTNELS